MAVEKRFLVVHGTAKDNRHCWATFMGRVGFEPHGVELRDLSYRDLGEPDLSSPGQLFVAARDWAVKQGHAAAMPTYGVEGSGNGRRFQVVVFSDAVAERRMVPVSELANFQDGNLDEVHGHPHNWACGRGYLTGFPSYVTDTEGTLVQAELVLIRKRTGSHQPVFHTDVAGGLPLHDFYGRLRQLQETARARGFLCAIPIGWCDHEQSHLTWRFNHDWSLRELQTQGWEVVDLHLQPAVADGAGLLHQTGTYTLQRTKA